MRAYLSAGLFVTLGLGLCGCGSGGYGTSTGGNLNSPTTPATSGAGVVTIKIVAIDGAQSFSPNPSSVPAGQVVVWQNVDTVTHHVVLNDRSIDTGDIAPGRSSAPMTMTGGQYHCTIHPEMIGSVNQDQAPAPPCQGAYCD
jgi:plastocyanin